jgi:ABC-type multidrug transport system fused ATPase/permease subunit
VSDHDQDDLDTGRIQLAFLGRLWPFVRPYRRGFAACLAILMVSFVLEMLGPLLLRHAIDGPMRDHAAGTDTRLRDLLWYGAGFLGTTLLGALLGYVYGLLTAWNGQRGICSTICCGPGSRSTNAAPPAS